MGTEGVSREGWKKGEGEDLCGGRSENERKGKMRGRMYGRVWRGRKGE